MSEELEFLQIKILMGHMFLA